MNDNSQPTLKDIRVRASDLLKEIDEFVNYVERKIKEREDSLDEKIKELAMVENDKKEFEGAKGKFEIYAKEIQKQKQANRDKQLSLDKKEDELQKQLDRIKTILT